MGIKAFKKAGAIVLVLFPIFTWVITGHHVQRSVYPLCVMEEEGRKIAQDASLTATLLLDNEIGQFLVYSQSQEEYGTSNYATWVLCKKAERYILLQNASVSSPISIMVLEDDIYIFGISTAFATMSGISITKYNFWKNQLIVENAIDISSVRNKFFIYQDELNRDVFSIIPKLGDGMGRMYFNAIDNAAVVSAMIVDSDREYLVELKLNSNGKYSL